MHPGMGLVSVALGGALGSVLRYLLAVWFRPDLSVLPWATLLANVAGCLLLGYLHGRTAINPGLLLLAGVGFCGGLTTFSTLSAELVHLGGASLLKAGLYLTITLWVGIGAYWLGLQWARA